MLSSAEAALVFLGLILPGFLAQGGYRVGRAVPEHPQGLVAVARVIAVSAAIALIAWKVGGRGVYDDARAGTALTSDEPHTYRFAFGVLVLPGLAGLSLGQAVDGLSRRLATVADALPPPPPPRYGERRRVRALRAALRMSGRLLVEGPTTWDRSWRKLRRTEPFAYARVTTTGGREVVGVVADASRVALSPQPRDLYLEQVLRQADDGNFYPTAFGAGIFVSGAEIESVEWVTHQAIVDRGSNG